MPDICTPTEDRGGLSRGSAHLMSDDHIYETCDENGQDPGGGGGDGDVLLAQIRIFVSQV